MPLISLSYLTPSMPAGTGPRRLFGQASCYIRERKPRERLGLGIDLIGVRTVADLEVIGPHRPGTTVTFEPRVRRAFFSPSWTFT